MAGIEYKPVYITDPREGPKGKLPYIELDKNNHKIADSHLIIEYLESQLNTERQPSGLDAHLTAEQKAISLLAKRTLDEHLVWVTLYSRWVPEKNFKIIKNTFFSGAAGPMKVIISKKVRKNMLQALEAQGMSRHNESEIYQLGKEDVLALSELLGKKTYFFGDKPSTLDATAYAHLASITHAPIESPLKRFTLEQANLVSLCERIDEQYFKDS